MVGYHRLKTGVGHFPQPGVKSGQKLIDRADQATAQSYNLPTLRRLAVTWAWICALSQIGNVAQQGFDAFVFVDPSLDLRDQILRDINGTGFALEFISQVVGQMAFTRLAVAAGVAALSAQGHQAGGDKRAPEC